MKNLMKLTTLVIVLAFSTQTVWASKIKNNTILSSGTEIAFSNFVHSNAKSIIKKNENEWNSLIRAIALYNVSPTEFLQYNKTKQLAFINSANTIAKELSKLNTEEANFWAKKIKVTGMVFEFVWKNKTATYTNSLPIQAPALN